jgi:hypothetical protein
MTAKMRRHFSGVFAAADCGKGAWRLSRMQPHPIEIFLRGIASTDAPVLAGRLTDVGIEWRDGRVFLSLTTSGGAAGLDAASALVHEALPKLYDTLPLAQFDAPARRFWRRVFFLVRIPGGRRLLKYLARTSRPSG